jgi:predicted nucleotidyltransferase
MDDFIDPIADALAGLPTVQAVSLGGSRAQGTARADSDWDFAIYYRAQFSPQGLRDVGWPGEVSEVGGWSRGVFNGGAWLMINGTPVDVHFRDVDVVEQQLARAERGEFDIEPLMFHLAGIPTYLVVAELAVNRVLHGALLRPDFPAALRESARRVWSDRTMQTLDYAEHNHARHGRLAQCAGQMAVAATQFAHAVLAAGGRWTTNEKTLLDRAGLRQADAIVAELTADAESLSAGVARLRELCRSAGNEWSGNAG